MKQTDKYKSPIKFREYPATVNRLVDGDTFYAEVDLGFRCSAKVKIRLHGINAPERKTPEGEVSMAALGRLIKVGDAVTLRVTGHDPYDRWVAEVHTGLERLNVNAAMVIMEAAAPAKA